MHLHQCKPFTELPSSQPYTSSYFCFTSFSIWTTWNSSTAWEHILEASSGSCSSFISFCQCPYSTGKADCTWAKPFSNRLWRQSQESTSPSSGQPTNLSVWSIHYVTWLTLLVITHNLIWRTVRRVLSAQIVSRCFLLPVASPWSWGSCSA